VARPVTKVKDPMSGFFAFKRSVSRRKSSTLWVQIALEVIVKGNVSKVVEVPIHFATGRRARASWAREMLRYIDHVTGSTSTGVLAWRSTSSSQSSGE